MRDSKSSLLLLVSLILFLMSFIILCTWGYNTYYKRKEDKAKPLLALNDSAIIANATKAIATSIGSGRTYYFDKNRIVFIKK